ncbi:MAG TPA: GNAT family N-acetyltransferase [Candidatus Binataceae bacterium]|jgi:GNAT superfamily N-acetyltransferase|nr:GNAT family N-acetyltransferase [Candidatus Binataceae bacterium]
MINIRLAQTDDEIAACFPIMRQLREHLVDTEFLQRIKLQQRTGYRLCYLTNGESAPVSVRSVAGFRLIENLANGRLLYIDDLVTDVDARSKGYGQKLLDWLMAEARAAGCDTLELDSGVQRFGAHRFYLRNRMDISSHHFRIHLKPPIRLG